MTARVLVTRPAAQAPELAALLEARGLEPVMVPTVAIDAASTSGDLDAMLQRLDDTAWLIITSTNGARALSDRLRTTDLRLPDGLRIAAVGPATAGALEEAGLHVDHVPDAYLTREIVDGLGGLEGRRVMLARADAATPDLTDALVRRGAIVDEVIAYRTVEAPPASRDPLQAALHADLGAIAFASTSAVRGLLRLAPPVDRARARSVPTFCIGPVTADAARALGFDVAAVAPEHTATGLADAIARHFAKEDR